MVVFYISFKNCVDLIITGLYATPVGVSQRPMDALVQHIQAVRHCVKKHFVFVTQSHMYIDKRSRLQEPRRVTKLRNIAAATVSLSIGPLRFVHDQASKHALASTVPFHSLASVGCAH